MLRIGLERLRLIEKAGLAEMMRSALAQLAEPAEQNPWAILDVALGASADEIEIAYRRAALEAHPDRGGTNEAMARVNAARAKLIEGAKP